MTRMYQHFCADCLAQFENSTSDPEDVECPECGGHNIDIFEEE